MEVLVPSNAIRNLIREDKIHQIYGMMQTGQTKHGMQTFNQSLAALYFKRLISLQTAMARSSYTDELQEIISRGPGALNPAMGAGGHREDKELSRCPVSCGKARLVAARRRKAFCWPTRATPRSRRLRRQQIAVTSIREKGRELPLLPKLPMRIKTKRISIFTRQFSVMLEAGLPLVQCLEILGQQEENRNFKSIIISRTDAPMSNRVRH